jgi:preprotein translocase subunit SecE
MASKSFFGFLQDVRTETTKVTWPGRREVMVTTGLVLLMCIFIGIFFVISDQIIRVSVGFILGIGN